MSIRKRFSSNWNCYFVSGDLFRARYIAELAEELYRWLPGSNPPFSTAYTFGDIAREYKLTWRVGSKLSAIQELLEQAEKSVVLVKVVTKVI